MIIRLFEDRTHAEPRLVLDGVLELLAQTVEPLARQIEDAQPHSAGDVNAHRVRDDRILHRQHAADGQAVPEVGVGHEGTPHRHRQRRRDVHLLQCVGIKALAPDRDLCRRCPGRERVTVLVCRLRLQERRSDLAPVLAVDEARRIVHDRPQVLPGITPIEHAGRGEALDDLPHPRHQLGRNAHLAKLFLFHDEHLFSFGSKQSRLRRVGFIRRVAGGSRVRRRSPVRSCCWFRLATHQPSLAGAWCGRDLLSSVTSGRVRPAE